jgi:hypothetical protein
MPIGNAGKGVMPPGMAGGGMAGGMAGRMPGGGMGGKGGIPPGMGSRFPMPGGGMPEAGGGMRGMMPQRPDAGALVALLRGGGMGRPQTPGVGGQMPVMPPQAPQMVGDPRSPQQMQSGGVTGDPRMQIMPYQQ